MNVPQNPFIGSVHWNWDSNEYFVYDGERWLKVQNSCPHCGAELEYPNLKSGSDVV